jgi:predicted lipoprotein with Yx(FWY)xxD motif
MRRAMAVLAAVILVAAALAGLAAIASSATHTTASVKIRSTSLGRIVVDGRSRTLYLFEKDKHGRSACSGACARNWPPLLTKGTPKAGTGTRSSLLGTTRRSDGTTQVTYDRHPLYMFALDKGRRGSTKGEGLDFFGGKWFVVGATGRALTGSATTGSSTAGGGY